MKYIYRFCGIIMAILFSVSPVAHAQEYFSRLSMEGVDLYGAILHGFVDEFTKVSPGYYKFNADNRYNPALDKLLLKANPAGGSVCHAGKIYCNEFGDGANVQQQKPMWRIYDASTFELLSETELTDNCECTTRSLAYDPVSGKIYGLNYTYTETFLVEIDPATGAMRRIGDKLDPKVKFLSIACSQRGQLYSIYVSEDPVTGDQRQYLVKFQKTTGQTAVVGEIKGENLLPGDMLVNMKYKQSLFFDNSSNRLYWMFGSSSLALGSEYTAIVEVNLLNAKATLRAYLPKSYHLGGVFFIEPPMGVPAVVSDFSFTPSAAGALDGTIGCVLPSTTYNGLSLGDAPLTVIVKEEGEEILRVEGLHPGSSFESGNLTFSNKEHRVSVSVENSVGESPAIERVFYVGFDEPDVCQNIRLTADGLTTTLTWDPPVAGLHGAPINTESYTYKILRWPGEITVAENMRERVFTETHPEDMTRYVYAVIPCDGDREGKSAFSNNYIVGTPLDTPYGGIFKSVYEMYNYYTILDENKDNCTWNYDKNTASAYYDYSMYNSADDWLVSPPINFKKDKEYVLRFKAYSSLYTYLESMEVRFGASRFPEGQSQLLLDIPVVPAVDEDNPVTQYEVPFKVDTDGVHHYSFHVYTERYHEFLFVFDIRVAEKEAGSLDVTQTDLSPVAVRGSDGCIHVSNPAGLELLVSDVNGRIVGRSTAKTAQFTVSPGLYLVKAGKQTIKTAVH